MSDDPAELPEDCVGPWLWDPAVNDPQQRSRPAAGDSAWPETRPDSLSAALLVVMETLPPLERAVFVLNEVFGYPHAEIADMLGRPLTPSGSWRTGHANTSRPAARTTRASAVPTTTDRAAHRRRDGP